MTRTAFLVVPMLVLGAAAHAQSSTAKPATVTINKIDANGVGQAIGTLTPRDTAQGLKITPKPPGPPPGPDRLHLPAGP